MRCHICKEKHEPKDLFSYVDEANHAITLNSQIQCRKCAGISDKKIPSLKERIKFLIEKNIPDEEWFEYIIGGNIKNYI